jgi:hypothetical protein
MLRDIIATAKNSNAQVKEHNLSLAQQLCEHADQERRHQAEVVRLVNLGRTGGLSPLRVYLYMGPTAIIGMTSSHIRMTGSHITHSLVTIGLTHTGRREE